MKKFSLLLVLLATYFCATAQLAPIQKIDASREIASARMKTVRLVKLQSAYVLFIHSTGNQFDKAAVFSLGETKESAVRTLADMLDLCDNLKNKESLVVKNNNSEVILTKRVQMGNTGLFFTIPGIAGKNTCVTKKELSKFHKALSEDKE